MAWWQKSERVRLATAISAARFEIRVGLPALEGRSRFLYEQALPRAASVARFTPDRPMENRWMAPHELAAYGYQPGQIVLGKFGGRLLGYLDDRPQITIAGARSGKTSTVLEPNLLLYPGSMLVMDPKGELARTAALRRALGHQVFTLDPFGQAGEKSASFNVLDELDPDSWTLVDDVKAIAQALVVDDGDARSRHWNDSARMLLTGIILLVMTLPPAERNLVAVRQLLSLTHPRLQEVVRKARARKTEPGKKRPSESALAVETLLRTMSQAGDRFGGILAAIGNRFLSTPPTERGSIFSTASAQTDFLDSLPLRAISTKSDFPLRALRGDRPVTICLCLPVGHMESHFRWLRLIVQMSCLALERMGPYPRERTPILYLMEEFATLGHMEIMERAAAYFPGFGVKLWVILQDLTQLRRHYQNGSWETFLGNAGLVQTFANGDAATLDYIAHRLEDLMAPFELREAFARQRFSQLLLFEGEPPAAALRLEHDDVAIIRRAQRQRNLARQRATDSCA